jgi:uncharacterized MAPEG superfamily protein
MWTMAHVVFGIAAVRVIKVLKGEAKPNSFPGDREHDGSDLYKRMMRVHMNCVENLPIFASVVLVGAVLDVTSPLLDALAITYLVGRVAQSITHLISTRSIAVNIRFGFYVVQVVAVVLMAGLTWQMA